MLKKRYTILKGTIRSQQVIENSSKIHKVCLQNNGGVAGVDINIQQPATTNGSIILLQIMKVKIL